MSDGLESPENPYYPVLLDLVGRRCVIVGGGKTALSKARALKSYGGEVVIITPYFTEALSILHHEEVATVELRNYVRGDLEDAFLVVSATGSEEVDDAVWAEAQERRCLINVIGRPDLCNFIVPSIVGRGHLQIAISTGGSAPVLARRLRKRFQEEFGEEWADYVDLLGQIRELLVTRVREEAKRKAILESIADSDLIDRMGKGDRPTAEDVIAPYLNPPDSAAGKAKGGKRG